MRAHHSPQLPPQPWHITDFLNRVERRERHHIIKTEADSVPVDIKYQAPHLHFMGFREGELGGNCSPLDVIITVRILIVLNILMCSYWKAWAQGRAGGGRAVWWHGCWVGCKTSIDSSGKKQSKIKDGIETAICRISFTFFRSLLSRWCPFCLSSWSKSY